MDGEHDEPPIFTMKIQDPFCGQDGRSASLTAPNGPAQERCLQVAGGIWENLGNFQVLFSGTSWIYPPPSNSGKWRFIGIPY